jgi:uncharacterized protein
MLLNWTSSATEMRLATDRGHGLFAVAAIEAGTVVAVFGGNPCDRATLSTLSPVRQMHSIQIDDDLFMVGAEDDEPGDMINHSCVPNCGLAGNVVVMARTDIRVDDEITYDYAMSDSSDYDEFVCACETNQCRGVVTGRDWLLPDLQTRYAGEFSTYLGRRIAQARSDAPQRRVFALDEPIPQTVETSAAR